ncbi:hypothetical protein PCASD_12671 [Puccinia coronata f. sp. avenae]|uniref:Uncharacterized protein n=1 Tax=Puccinia coronata f. sp. avenae TaxID=200324 RepID=A0A2N5UDW8_9BASI|nr:hypothetical protein PCASD_12671 [Puccinia coronata f. sp. avenae]
MTMTTVAATTVVATTTPTTTAAVMVTGRFYPGATFGMGAGRLVMVRMDSDRLSLPSSRPTVPPWRYHHHPHQLPAPSSKLFESNSQFPKQAPVSPTRTRLNTLIARASPQAHLPPDPPTIPTAPLFAAGYPHPHSYQQQQQQQSGLRDSPRSPRPAPSSTALAQNQTHMLHHHLHMLHCHHSLQTHHPDPRDDPLSSPFSSPTDVN